MSKKVFIFLLCFYINYSSSQSFITLDNDTNEFIEDVNYSLFLKKKNVFNGITENKKITTINNQIDYDSISFSRVDYNTIGYAKESIDSIVYLTKKIFYLNEIVLTSKKNNFIVIGEKNRFIKNQSRAITEELIFGIIHKNDLNKNLIVKKVNFFIEKTYHKTKCRINFYEVNETIPKRGNQFAEIGNLIFSTDTLQIEKNYKKNVEVDINSEIILNPNKNLFVTIELLNYVDENNNIINPKKDELTKLKFQISEKTNYYSKTINHFTKEMINKLMNINLMINYDFANHFFLKPHKSILVSPAIILYAKEYED